MPHQMYACQALTSLHLFHQFRQFRTEAGGLGFVAMLNGIFKQQIQPLDFLNHLVSLWHRHLYNLLLRHSYCVTRTLLTLLSVQLRPRSNIFSRKAIYNRRNAAPCRPRGAQRVLFPCHIGLINRHAQLIYSSCIK